MPIGLAEFGFIRELVASRSGVVLSEKERYLVEARLLPLARVHKFNSINEIIQKLRQESANGLPDHVVDALLPKDTCFFRDLHPFELLRSLILKTLEMKRFNDRRLRIWCAGCSSGQEAYSVAMSIHYYFSQLLSWELDIFATDLSEEALAQAREGNFNEIEVNRGLPTMMARQFMKKEGTRYLVAEEVKERIQFERLNLVGTWPELPQMDLILFRNVLTYLAPMAKKTVLEKIGRLLKPDGYLLLGARETTVNLDPSFTLVPAERTVYFQRQSAPSLL